MLQNVILLNHTDLLLQINLAKIQKQKQEQELKIHIKDFVETLNPVTVIKESLHSLVSDTGIRQDLTKTAVHFGANVLIDVVVGRYRSVKGFLGSIFLEKLADPFINRFFVDPLHSQNSKGTNDEVLK